MVNIDEFKGKIREELILNGYKVRSIDVRNDGAIIVDTISPKTGCKAIIEIPEENVVKFFS